MKRLILSSIAALCACMIISGCESSTGSPKLDLTPPPIPSDFSISQIGNGAVTLTWSPVSDSDLQGYHLYWQGGGSLDTLKANRLFTSATSVTITDLDYETTYSFAVSSIDRSGNESRLSPTRSGTPFNTTPPLPPTGVDLVAENIEFPKITLYWSENTEPDIAHYAVYRALSSSGINENSTPLALVAEQKHYTDTSIEVGVVYYYCVTAVDRGGKESSSSAVAADSVLPKVTLSHPVNFEYVNAAPVFSWHSVNGAKKYNVVITTSRIGGEIWNIEVDGGETQVAYTGKTKLISGNTYYWKVGAISRREINSVSSIGSFVVRTP